MNPSLLLGVLTFAQPGYAESIAALETAYEATPNPDILLSIASTYERWPGHCKETIDTYRRFFDACDACVGLSQATDRFDLALERCVGAEEEIELRERFAIPNREHPRKRTADATRDEIAELIRQARKIDRAEAGRIYVTFIESGFGATPAALNALRERVWAVLLRKEAGAEEALAMIGRIRLVDQAAYRRMLDELVSAQEKGNEEAFNRLRAEALSIVRNHATQAPTVAKRTEGCRANPAYELGYLTIDTRPWSEVYVNGEPIGTTPVAKYEVVAGCATVRAISPSNGKELVMNASIRPNRTTILSLDLSTEGAREIRSR